MKVKVKKCIMPLPKLERIAKEEFLDNLIACHDRVEKENVGFVIEDAEGGDIAMIPFHWTILFDEETFYFERDTNVSKKVSIKDMEEDLKKIRAHKVNGANRA